VIDKKLDALDVLVSQFFEGGALGSADLMKQQDRGRQVRTGFANRNQAVAKRFRAKLADWYGKEQADNVQYAEAFEVCEYGRRPNRDEMARLFPFVGE
jgi:hypothetical protein